MQPQVQVRVPLTSLTVPSCSDVCRAAHCGPLHSSYHRVALDWSRGQVGISTISTISTLDIHYIYNIYAIVHNNSIRLYFRYFHYCTNC